MPLSGYLKLFCKSDILVDIKKVWRHVPYLDVVVHNLMIERKLEKMNEKDVAELIVNYLSENLFKVIGLTITSLGTVITGTWFICKNWYKREINHLKSSKESECKILNERINFLGQKLNDNNTYAQGILEVANEQMRTSKQELNYLPASETIKKYENEITEMKSQYDEEISILKKEKQSLNERLNSLKTSKSQMLDTLNIVIEYNNSFEQNKLDTVFFKDYLINLSKNKDDNKFYERFSKFSTILCSYQLYNFNTERKTKIDFDKLIIQNNIKNLQYTVKIITPFIKKENSTLDKFIKYYKEKNKDISEEDGNEE